MELRLNPSTACHAGSELPEQAKERPVYSAAQEGTVSGAISPAALLQPFTGSATLVGSACGMELVPDRCNLSQSCPVMPSTVPCLLY
jgi:hypothetical protein